MARAKRTNRAEARRRHRAHLVETGDQPADDGLPAPPDARPRAARPGTAGTDLSAPRPAPAGGIRSAFAQAYRPLKLREDLAMLPRLLAHRAFWLPILIAGGISAAVIAFQGRELLTFQGLIYFVAPPPIGAVFLCGFLAPRASYLLGALIGAITAPLFAFVLGTVPSVAAFFDGSTAQQAFLSAIVVSPLGGMLIAASAAWYRRFLYLASPARRMAAQRPPARGRPARGR